MDRALLPTRHSDAWYMALDEFIDARAPIAFAWGTNDCCTFAADWVEVARGTDPMADLRGITSERQAARVLRDEGGLLAAVTARMGIAIPGTMAQVGDVALVRHGEGRLSMGVCLGDSIAVPSEAGLARAPITTAEAAWRV